MQPSAAQSSTLYLCCVVLGSQVTPEVSRQDAQPLFVLLPAAVPVKYLTSFLKQPLALLGHSEGLSLTLSPLTPKA